MIQFESDDPEVKALFEKLKANDPENIDYIDSSQFAAQQIATLVIENWGALSPAALATLAMLRFHEVKFRISRDGIELSGKRKREILDPDGDE